MANLDPVRQSKEWVIFCENSAVIVGSVANFHWSILPEWNENNDPKQNRATKLLARSIYATHQENKRLSVRFYYLLHSAIIDKLHDYMDLFVVLFTDNNAYKYMINCPYIHWSNVDIVIAINPALAPDIYDMIRSTLHECIVETIAKYKRGLDDMLFDFFNQHPYSFMERAHINTFKTDLLNTLGNEFTSPFANVYIRNHCSQRSYMVTPSRNPQHIGSVVKIELDHFDNSCRLTRTPIVASFDTLGHYSLRMNM